MSCLTSCIYEGVIVHKRLTPRRHAFSYRVFALCIDVDEIDLLDCELRLFSRGKRNLMSFWDGDLGAPGTVPVAEKARDLLAQSGLDRFGHHIQLVCYPRLYGYVFNPLSVYFCRDASGAVGAVIYEVTNTFAERKSYVIPVDGAGRMIAQSCAKALSVSPFTNFAGGYSFHCLAPAERVVIGVNYREAGEPVLKTHFSGERRALSDATIAKLLVKYPLMTLKVVAAIHLQAARLWLKGVPIGTRHASQSYSVTIVDGSIQETHHA